MTARMSLLFSIVACCCYRNFAVDNEIFGWRMDSVTEIERKEETLDESTSHTSLLFRVRRSSLGTALLPWGQMFHRVGCGHVNLLSLGGS